MPIDWEEEITQTIPRGGDKKKLLELSLHNANYFMQEYKRHQALHLDEQNLTDKNQLLARLQQELRLPQIPMHIECFDNSNFQGSYPVAAMVCFKQGVPYKKEYRHFHIKTVEGINDFASMKEIVRRRYERVLEEGADIPQLIIIDGGKGQLSSAMEVIKDLGLVGKTTVVGLAKNVEELFFPGDQQSILLDYQSPTLNLLKYIRDEVHRFGITFHRKTRSKGIVKNELEEIAGIGPALAKQLLIEFRSIKKIKEAPLQRIEEAIGKSKAKLVYDHFHPAE
jgi:excinuclease ABC subunit C